MGDGNDGVDGNSNISAPSISIEVTAVNKYAHTIVRRHRARRNHVRHTQEQRHLHTSDRTQNPHQQFSQSNRFPITKCLITHEFITVYQHL